MSLGSDYNFNTTLLFFVLLKKDLCFGSLLLMASNGGWKLFSTTKRNQVNQIKLPAGQAEMLTGGSGGNALEVGGLGCHELVVCSNPTSASGYLWMLFFGMCKMSHIQCLRSHRYTGRVRPNVLRSREFAEHLSVGKIFPRQRFCKKQARLGGYLMTMVRSPRFTVGPVLLDLAAKKSTLMWQEEMLTG